MLYQGAWCLFWLSWLSLRPINALRLAAVEGSTGLPLAGNELVPFYIVHDGGLKQLAESIQACAPEDKTARDVSEHSTEYYIYTQMLSHPWRRHDPAKADIFYVPVFPFMSTLAGTCNGTTHVDRMIATRDAVKAWTSTMMLSDSKKLLIASTHYKSMYYLKSAKSALKDAIFANLDEDTFPLFAPHGNRRCGIEIPYLENAYVQPGKSDTKHGGRTTLLYFRGSIHEIINKTNDHLRETREPLLKLPERSAAWSKLAARFSGGENGVKIDELKRRRFNSTSKKEYAVGMQTSVFCLVPRGDTSSSSRLYDAVAAGCVPIVISDKEHGAFKDLVDYSAFMLRISEADFKREPEQSLLRLLDTVTPAELQRRRDALRQAGTQVLYRQHNSKVATNLLLTAKTMCDPHRTAMQYVHR